MNHRYFNPRAGRATTTIRTWTRQRAWEAENFTWIALSMYYLAQQLLTLLAHQFSPTPVDEAFAAILAPFCGLALLSRQQQRLRLIFGLYCLYALIMLAGNLVGSGGGVPQPKGWIYDSLEGLKPLVMAGGFAFLFGMADRPQRILVWFAWIMSVLAIINSPFVLYDLLSHGVGFRGLPLPTKFHIFQPFGLQLHQTRSVWLSSVGAFSSLYLARYYRQVVFYAAGGFLVLIAFVHFSVKESIAIAVVLALFMAGRSSSKVLGRLFMGAGALAVAAIVLSSTPLGTVISNQFETYSAPTGSNLARPALTRAAAEIALDHFPLGSGGGTFASSPSYEQGYSWTYVQYGLDTVWGLRQGDVGFYQDVYWPEMLAEGGILGFAVYVWMFVLLVSPTIYLFLRSRTPESWFILAVVVFALFVSTASAPFTDEFLGVLFSMAAGYGLGVPKVLAPNKSIKRRRAGGGRGWERSPSSPSPRWGANIGARWQLARLDGGNFQE